MAADCARCRRPFHAPHAPDENPTAGYTAGDICAIQERTSTPVYTILSERPRLSRTSMMSRGRGSVGGSASFHSLTGPARASTFSVGSGSFYQDLSPGTRPPARVCLLATFGGESDIRALPKVLQHFVIPIYPYALASPGLSHTHTTPEWPREGTWLIGIPFYSDGLLGGRWEDRRPEAWDAPDRSYKFEEEELVKILSSCEQKLHAWEALCDHDVEYRESCTRGYKAFGAKAGHVKKSAVAQFRAADTEGVKGG
ncbi:hypothetical protein BD413DRAFT_492002 [Trametes elegans]|nr:hypothetical protein BD413DRAFT_492002 [Trametes elegans]